MVTKSSLSVDELREVLDYDPTTGIFVWKSRSRNLFNSVFAGKQAGCLHPSGYMTIVINGIGYRAHRLAWLYCYGEWPQHEIDHKDRNPVNNAICNLADVLPADNCLNRNRIGVSGKKGIRQSGQRWMVRVIHKGKILYVGTFDTIEQASVAYDAALLNIELIYQKKIHQPVYTQIPSETKISHDELLSLLTYDSDTGIFRWIKSPTQKQAGSLEKNGYIRIGINKRLYLAHVLAVFYMTKEWPEKIVDHINGHPSDNRWCNLRQVIRSQNALNMKKVTTKGIRRAHKTKQIRWEAAITLEGTRHHIGTFDTEDEAKSARTAFVIEQGLADYAL